MTILLILATGFSFGALFVSLWACWIAAEARDIARQSERGR
jgi:hypothetical protein